MKAQISSAALLGIEAITVTVDVELTPDRVAAYHVVGLSSTAGKESSVRVRAALEHSGWKLPACRVTVHLSPADIHTDGAAFDLPIAVALLAAMERIPTAALNGMMLLGELSLDGTLRRLSGGLPVAMHARATGVRALILPRDCASEAAVVTGLAVHAAATLAEVGAFLRGDAEITLARFVPSQPVSMDVDLAEVRGLATARRALEIAAAGGHNILLVGPPGSGKSLLARCLPTVLPPLGESEAIETTAIYSAAGKLGGESLLSARPFRAPHHDVSVAGLVGGGVVPRPGEITLAHHGVLFLDELLEFKRDALEALRQPLENRNVKMARAKASLTYPASFVLVGAMNPCPCGFRGCSQRECVCTEERVKRYLGRLSRSLRDHVDLLVDVPHVDYRTLRDGRAGESSAAVRERVVKARAIAERRLKGAGKRANAQLGPRQVREHCALDTVADRHLETCARRFDLHARAVHQILCVARTIADLAGRERIAASDVAEALALRVLDHQQRAVN